MDLERCKLDTISLTRKFLMNFSCVCHRAGTLPCVHMGQSLKRSLGSKIPNNWSSIIEQGAALLALSVRSANNVSSHLHLISVIKLNVVLRLYPELCQRWKNFTRSKPWRVPPHLQQSTSTKSIGGHKTTDHVNDQWTRISTVLWERVLLFNHTLAHVEHKQKKT